MWRNTSTKIFASPSSPNDCATTRKEYELRTSCSIDSQRKRIALSRSFRGTPSRKIDRANVTAAGKINLRLTLGININKLDTLVKAAPT